MSVDVQGKSLVDLLDMLEPAPAPEPISMMPQTWGWLVVVVALALLVGFGVAALVRHRKMNAYRRAALMELSGAENNPEKIASILRRTALAAYPRRKIAALSGQNWIDFLLETSDKINFSETNRRSLLQAPYQDTPADPDLAKLAQDWIRSHKRMGTS